MLISLFQRAQRPGKLNLLLDSIDSFCYDDVTFTISFYCQTFSIVRFTFFKCIAMHAESIVRRIFVNSFADAFIPLDSIWGGDKIRKKKSPTHSVNVEMFIYLKLILFYVGAIKTDKAL